MSIQLDSTPQNVCIVAGKAGSASPSLEKGLFSGFQWELLRSKLVRAGISPDSVTFLSLESLVNGASVPEGSLIIGMGEGPLHYFTEKRGIDKWQLSPLLSKQGQKFIPTYDLERIQKQYELGLYLEMALVRAKEEYATARYDRAPERFHLNPGIEETLSILERIQGEPELAVDIETGYGQINTVGFAWSASDAIAINVLPDRCSDESYYRLWGAIRRVLVSESRKILQNFIYDVSYFSAYGIRVEGEIFDTMWAMKVLWPELKSNLGNVGRIYTRRPYWKDDGKVTDEEGQKKDWGAVRDWIKHYTYNCRDTTGTFEASQNQQNDLSGRGLSSFFRDYISRFNEPVLEMCTTGMPLSLATREQLRSETKEKIERLTKDFQAAVGSELNPRSSRQILSYLEASGVNIPKKYNKDKGTYNKSSDAASIKKIRLKNDLPGLKELQQIKTLDKALSSYIDFDVRPDGRLSYSLNGCGTETLRMSGGKDGWDRGFNIQTIPREGGDVSIKSMFVAPEGFSFIEVDLRQAESRFVAYDSGDKTLIDMLESGADVHSHVGNAILTQMGRDPKGITKDEFKATWRQLGKKAGHGLNYYMKPRMFVETVFNELDLVISVRDAEAITEAYYGLFPGIPRWHAWIRNELYHKRKLSAPSGWERYFYGRPGTDMQKEAYAFRPQHTIPWVMNHLMLYLVEERKKNPRLDFRFIYQGHDSLTLLLRDESLMDVARICSKTEPWHPEIILPGGRLRITTEVKAGACIATLKEINCD